MADDNFPQDAPIRDILIVGGTAAGWMTAGVLARTLPATLYRIGLLDSGRAPAGLEGLDAGEATLPPLAAVHELVGIGWGDLLRHADATFSLGASFADFAPGSAYFRTHGVYGKPLQGVAFHNLWERMRRKGLGIPLEEYSLAATAARLGRFAPSSDDPDSILSTFDQSWHLDGSSHRRMLRVAAERAGAARIAGEVANVARRVDDGFIEAVVLGDGRRLEADLFIDCTPDGALIEGALASGWEDWRHWLPCDTAIATRTDRAEAPTPYWRGRAHGAGWGWRIPLQSGDGCGHVYASAFSSDAEAEAAFARALGGDPAGVTRARFASGRRTRIWDRNCIAIGASACVLDPIEPTAFQIVQDGISHFLSLMPRKSCDAGEADEYNRLMSETVERMRDLVILHYKANTRDEPFWAECRDMPVPDLLDHKMRIFEAEGRVLEWDEESFFEADWAAVYFGQGLGPRRYDPLAEVPDAQRIRDHMSGIRQRVREAAEGMPLHDVFIQACLAQ